MKRTAALLAVMLLSSAPAFAEGWSANLGYHNPVGSSLGLNFMHLWTNWALELGVGYIGKSENWNQKDNSKNANYTVGGDINMKYLFRQGVFRPYLQGGIGIGATTSDSGNVSAGASVTHPFGGAGLMFMGQSAYIYIGYLFLNAGEAQAGVGINF